MAPPPQTFSAAVQEAIDQAMESSRQNTSARQNFSSVVEGALNEQINRELYASYQYLAMSAFFGRTDIALPGATEYFKNQSLEERQHAQKLIDYVNDRGGKVRFSNILPPGVKWGSLLEAFQDAVVLEKMNNKSLLALHQKASEENDPDLTNFLEEYYLREQVIEIQEMTRKANQLRRMGEGLGEHIFDQELVKEMKKKGEKSSKE